MAKNEVYVTTDLQDERLWSEQLQLADLHWINNAPQPDQRHAVRTRYRAPLVQATRLTPQSTSTTLLIDLNEEIRAITPGQSTVIYDGDRVVGGGIVV